MNTENYITELNVTLSNEQDIQANDIETLDVELADIPHKWTQKNLKAYRGKLRLMDQIHNEIADKLNAKRQSIREMFFRVEDEYIPETKHNDYLSLWMSAAKVMPNCQ